MDNVSAQYTLEIFDSCGNIVQTHTDLSKSFTGNFVYLLGAMFDGVDAICHTVDDTWKPTCGFTIDIPDDDDYTHGIVIGSGTASVTFDDYTMDTLITSIKPFKMNGVLTGVDTTEENGYYKTTIASRYFKNISGEDLSINEMGLVVKSNDDYYLVIRDVFDVPFTLDNEFTLSIRYTLITSANESFTQNFHNIIYSSLTNQVCELVDTNGALFTPSKSCEGIAVARSLDNYDFGVVVGDGNDVRRFDGYRLSGMLYSVYEYGILHQSGMSPSERWVDGDMYLLDLKRTFTNFGVFDAVITEIGLVAVIDDHNVLLMRDVVEPIGILPQQATNIIIRICTVL